MLVQVALVVFALSAMLSLVIDLGYAHLTQGQMQSAADSAAIEGIRQRDAVPNPAAADAARREAVNTVVGWTFDDNFDPTDGDVDYQFGAGPIIDLTEGATSLHGLQMSSVPEQHVYKPNLQANPGNAPEGDMVSGRFCYSADPLPSENVAYEMQDTVCGQPQLGAGTYTRNDFNPGGANPNAFLVRLRRSNEYQDLEGRTDPDVGSSGPSLPLTFGKATTIHGDDPAATYSVRRDGLTVRATAIAETRPALHVGLPQANPPILGVTPFALLDTFAPGIAGTPVTIGPGTGFICSGGGNPSCNGPAPVNVVGRFIDNLQDPTRMRWTSIDTVGRLLPAAVALNCVLVNTFTGYGPTYSATDLAGARIIGFSRITLVADPARPGNPCAKRISRAPSAVAPANATAVLSNGLPADLPPALITQLLDRNLVRNGAVNYGPVLAPVLAR